ncbi:hypothetical protein HMPREF2736_08310 [Corynebacterium sp. HMSC036E10]|nr:hypothetical protein HMPREF2736_08310 [Corynebacterium sp. HMSC036E10]
MWDGDDHCQGEQRVEDKRHLSDQGSNFPGHVLGRADLDDNIQADRIFEVHPQLRLVNCAVVVHPDHEDTALTPKACAAAASSDTTNDCRMLELCNSPPRVASTASPEGPATATVSSTSHPR